MRFCCVFLLFASCLPSSKNTAQKNNSISENNLQKLPATESESVAVGNSEPLSAPKNSNVKVNTTTPNTTTSNSVTPNIVTPNAAEPIAVPSASADLPVSNSASESPVTLSPVDGGWSSVGAAWWANVENNTEYRTMYCNNPSPARGGKNCIVPSGWTSGIKDGVLYAYKATTLCRNNFAWNGSECSRFIDLSKYWPVVKEGETLSKYYAFNDEFNPGVDRFYQVQHHQKIQTEAGYSDSYTLSTYLGFTKESLSNANARSDVWYYGRKNGSMFEFRDLLFPRNPDYTYGLNFTDAYAVPGGEIQWGGANVYVGYVLESNVQYKNGGTGYSKMEIVRIESRAVVRGKEYKDVAVVSVYQKFNDLDFQVTYRMVPDLGFIQAFYWDREHGINSVKHLTDVCRTVASVTKCN